MRTYLVSCGTLLLLTTIAVLAQDAPWTVVRFPSETPVNVGLVGVDQPAGGGKQDTDTGGPSGSARITRGDKSTNIVINISGFRGGTHYVYLIDVNGRARKIDSFKGSYAKAEYNEPADEAEAFMIIISADGDITGLPPRNRIELYSVAPRNLPVIRPKR